VLTGSELYGARIPHALARCQERHGTSCSYPSSTSSLEPSPQQKVQSATGVVMPRFLSRKAQTLRTFSLPSLRASKFFVIGKDPGECDVFVFCVHICSLFASFVGRSARATWLAWCPRNARCTSFQPTEAHPSMLCCGASSHVLRTRCEYRGQKGKSLVSAICWSGGFTLFLTPLAPSITAPMRVLPAKPRMTQAFTLI
jgi:hypothetical protein